MELPARKASPLTNTKGIIIFSPHAVKLLKKRFELLDNFYMSGTIDLTGYRI